MSAADGLFCSAQVRAWKDVPKISQVPLKYDDPDVLDNAAANKAMMTVSTFARPYLAFVCCDRFSAVICFSICAIGPHIKRALTGSLPEDDTFLCKLFQRGQC